MLKSKKILTVSSLFLATALFASCAGPNNVVTFNDYWQNNPDANLTKFQETLVYNVTYEEKKGLAEGYELAYSNGTYITTLTLVTENAKSYYRYETSFAITASFTYGDEIATFNDSIVTWVTFEKSASHLQPIASHKELSSHSPANVSEPEKMEDCYTFSHFTVDTTYSSDLKSGKTVIKNCQIEGEKATNENSFEIKNEKKRYIDNEQLYVAMRAINPSNFSVPELLVYAPFTKKVQPIKATFTSEEGKTRTFKRNGVDVTESIELNSVSLNIDEKNPGEAQTLWIAKRQDTTKWRNVIFKMELPLSYSMGALVFDLVSETFVEE